MPSETSTTCFKAITLSPGHGQLFEHAGNDDGSSSPGTHANENYAREVKQLFSIGLNRMWPDGTLVMNAQGNLVPTYNQYVIEACASVSPAGIITRQTRPTAGCPRASFPPRIIPIPWCWFLRIMSSAPSSCWIMWCCRPAQGVNTNTALTNFDYYCSQDLESTINSIFNHQNVGPFICRELIQRLVTSNPSRDYIYRVAQVFNNDGTGVRGNMQAVIQAILLDYEARSTVMITEPTYGKLREPLLRATAPARAFPPPGISSGTYGQNGTQVITVTNTAPHRLVSGDTVFLTFTDTSGNAAPTSQGYSVTTTSTTNFTINATGLATGTYAQSNSTITVSISGHGLLVGNPVYLAFTTGGATNGVFQVLTVPDSSHLTVATTDTNTHSGNCLIPKLSAAGYSQTKTNITISIFGTHGLSVGNSVYIRFTSGSATNGTYQVTGVIDPTHFTITSGNSVSQTDNSLTVYSLAMPPLVRSGTVVNQQSTWNMSYSDSDITQTPLRSPTVFNFFFPGFEFPGTLAAAGLTTPEFQLMSDSLVALQLNFLENAFLSTGNTNGLTSLRNNGTVRMDLGPWMTPAYTSNAGVPSLVNGLNTLLAAGQLSPAAQTTIINYIANTTNFPYTTPTSSQMFNRVRGAVHLIITSPDYTIQK